MWKRALKAGARWWRGLWKRRCGPEENKIPHSRWLTMRVWAQIHWEFFLLFMPDNSPLFSLWVVCVKLHVLWAGSCGKFEIFIKRITFQGLPTHHRWVLWGNCELPDIFEQHLLIYRSVTGIICSLYRLGNRELRAWVLFLSFSPCLPDEVGSSLVCCALRSGGSVSVMEKLESWHWHLYTGVAAWESAKVISTQCAENNH